MSSRSARRDPRRTIEPRGRSARFDDVKSAVCPSLRALARHLRRRRRPVLAQAAAGRLQPEHGRRPALALRRRLLRLAQHARTSLAAADPDEYIRNRRRDGISRFSRQPLDEGHWQRLRPPALLRARQLRRCRAPTNELKAAARGRGPAVRRPAAAASFTWPCRRRWWRCASPHLRDAGMVTDPNDASAFTRVDRREADRPRPGERPRPSSGRSTRPLPKARPTASTITSARRRCRT